jgi:type IV secretory pathway ATPase VirB11/archaellum biosynthesis ATPase
MTALSGAGLPIAGAHDSMSMAADRPESGAAAARPRPLDQIFPLRGDANRGREMQATWRSFCRDRSPAVKTVLSAGRSPPEIAYQLGELLHNHFRTRGVTLTSDELRRLVAELLTPHGPPSHGPSPAPEGKPAGLEKTEEEEASPLADRWSGDTVSMVRPSVPEKPVQPPPAPAVTVAPREPVPFAQLLTRALALAKGRLVSRDRQAVRVAVDEAVASVAGEQGGELSVDARERLAAVALTEMAGLGLIDRLWSDRTVRAIFVNGPASIVVDRDGTLETVSERFRDQAHLVELVSRLVGLPTSGMADFRLRDGTSGFVIFPPMAPDGPILTLQRYEPAEATLERLVSGGQLDQPMADLLRLGVRSRLNMLVTGPAGAGKTALLAAIARDVDAAQRVVTVARHRHFRSAVASKVELVASPMAPFASLIAAGARLEPALLVLDGVESEDVAALSNRLVRGESGILASIRPDTMPPELAQSVDFVARLGRGEDGRFGVTAIEDSAGSAIFRREGGKLSRETTAPALAAKVRLRGHGEALAQLLR